MSFFDIQELYNKITSDVKRSKHIAKNKVAPAIKNYLTIDETRAVERVMGIKVNVLSNRMHNRETGKRLTDSFTADQLLCDEARKVIRKGL